MWLLGKSTRQKAHRELIALATAILGKFSAPHRSNDGDVYFDVRSVPLEFRKQVHDRLENLLFHAELPQRDPKELGDSENLRELGDDVRFMQAYLSGLYPPALRTRLRAITYSEAFRDLAGLLVDIERHPGIKEMHIDLSEGLIEASREALSWFPDEASLSAARRELGESERVFQMMPRAAASAMLEKVDAFAKAAGKYA